MASLEHALALEPPTHPHMVSKRSASLRFPSDIATWWANQSVTLAFRPKPPRIKNYNTMSSFEFVANELKVISNAPARSPPRLSQGVYTSRGCRLCAHYKTSAYGRHGCTQSQEQPRGTQSHCSECRTDYYGSHTLGNWEENRIKL